MNFIAQSIITSIAFSAFSIALPTTTGLSTCIPTYPQQSGQNGAYRMALANQSSVVITYDASCTSKTNPSCSQLNLQTFGYGNAYSLFFSSQEGKSSLGFEIATDNDETSARCFTGAIGSSDLELLACVPNALDQKFNFTCSSCNTGGPQFGTACQIRTETDMCITSAGKGKLLYLSGCDVEAKDAAQIFNLIA